MLCDFLIIRGETTDQVKENMNGCQGARGGDRSRLQRGAEEFFRGKELFYLTVPLWWGRTTIHLSKLEESCTENSELYCM